MNAQIRTGQMPSPTVNSHQISSLHDYYQYCTPLQLFCIAWLALASNQEHSSRHQSSWIQIQKLAQCITCHRTVILKNFEACISCISVVQVQYKNKHESIF